MNEDIYLKEYKERSRDLNNKINSLNDEINYCWKEIEDELKIELKNIFYALECDIESIFNNPSLRDKFTEKLLKVEAKIFQKMEKLNKKSELDYQRIKDIFILAKNEYLEVYKVSNEETSKRKEILEKLILKIDLNLKESKNLKESSENLVEKIKYEVKNFFIFTEEKALKKIDEKYEVLEKKYVETYDKKITINRIDYLKVIKEIVGKREKEIKEKLKNLKKYSDLKLYIEENGTEYFKELDKYIEADVEIRKVLINARVLKIYQNRYQKDVLEIKKLSENFKNEFYTNLKEKYSGISLRNLENIDNDKWRYFEKIKKMGEEILSKDSLISINSYFLKSYSNIDEILKNKSIQIGIELKENRESYTKNIEILSILENIDRINLEKYSYLKKEKEYFEKIKNTYILNFKNKVEKSLEKDKKDILMEISNIFKKNSLELNQLEILKKLKLKDDYSIEYLRVTNSSETLKSRYLVVNKLKNEKIEFYSNLFFKANTKLFIQEIERFTNECIDLERKEHDKYYRGIKNLENERNLMIKDFNKRFEITLNSGLDDLMLKDDLKRYKSYNIILPNLESIELYIKEREQLKKKMEEGIFKKMKFKLYLNTKKIRDYKGINNE